MPREQQGGARVSAELTDALSDRDSLLGQLANRPGTRELAVHVPERRREARIGEPQQAGRRAVTRGRPQRFDEQDLHEPREHEVAA